MLLIVSCSKENDKNNCNQDFIIAGDSLSNCYEIISIDTFIRPSQQYSVDLDNDDSIDLKIKTYYLVASQGRHHREGCYLINENPLLDLSVRKDSLFWKYANIKNVMDTIGENENWSNRYIIDISSLETFLSEGPSGNIWTSYYDSTNKNIKQKYIGIRISKASFTSYYWIKLSIKDYSEVRIEELGRQIR